MKHKGHLEVVNPDTGEVGDKRVWMVNNQIVFTDDGFKTSKSVLGEFTVDDVPYYGLLAQAVIAGYIEGSKIVGCDINIGNGAFVVDGKTGAVTMSMPEGSSIDGYAKEDDLEKITETVKNISSSKMYKVEITTTGPTIISTSEDEATLTCRVYSWDADITDTLDESLFNWRRKSNNAELDDIWNAMPEHQGVKLITIDTDDVVDNSSFTCEVDLPE